ncbi:hypothetical protein [Streptomyces canus]|uniref:hypothetical protein n=1 Tax=Streptomyces canus TaxID=58343 RepID=UPI002E336E7D|nr:hypothetical protein [Streptomyces canus]
MLGWLSNQQQIPSAVHSRLSRAHARVGDVRHLKMFRESDIRDNDGTRIPATEKVALRAMWVVEFYTPPDMETMARRLQEVDEMAPSATFTKGYEDWFRAARKDGGGGWIRLPDFARPGWSAFGRDQIFGTLPEGAVRANCALFGVTHGISALVVRFDYEDDFAEGYGELLREDQGKRLEPLKNGFSLVGPSSLKKRKVKSWRKARVKEASDWVSANFPGHFSRAGEHLPSVHLITTAERVPWESEPTGDGMGGYEVLEAGYTVWPYWQCSTLTSLRVQIASDIGPYLRNDLEGVLVCASRESDLLSGEPVGVGSDYSSSVGHAMHGMEENLSNLTIRWGLDSYVARLGKQVADVRDRATAISSIATYGAFVDLRNKLLVTGIESQLVAKEIVTFCESRRWLGEGSEYNQVLTRFYLDAGRQPVNLHAGLAKRIIEESRRISQVEKEIRELVSAAADLTNAAYGIRLQAVVLWLTVVSVVVAVIALLVAN